MAPEDPVPTGHHPRQATGLPGDRLGTFPRGPEARLLACVLESVGGSAQPRPLP